MHAMPAMTIAEPKSDCRIATIKQKPPTIKSGLRIKSLVVSFRLRISPRYVAMTMMMTTLENSEGWIVIS